MTKEIKSGSILEKEVEGIALLDDRVIKDKIWKAKVLNILKRSKLVTQEEASQLENLIK